MELLRGLRRLAYPLGDVLFYGVHDARLEGDILGEIVELFFRSEDAEQFVLVLTSA